MLHLSMRSAAKVSTWMRKCSQKPQLEHQLPVMQVCSGHGLCTTLLSPPRSIIFTIHTDHFKQNLILRTESTLSEFETLCKKLEGALSCTEIFLYDVLCMFFAVWSSVYSLFCSMTLTVNISLQQMLWLQQFSKQIHTACTFRHTPLIYCRSHSLYLS